MTREERLDWLCRLRGQLVYFDMSDHWRTNFTHALSDEIHDLQQESKAEWIPVSERLPKEDGCYLVTAELVVDKPRVEISSFAKNLYSVDEYEFFNKKGKSGWYNYDDDYGYWENEEVIAWMPLPESYKTESEEK